MAAAVLRGLLQRMATGQGFEAHTSLARTAHLLVNGPEGREGAALAPAAANDWSDSVEATGFGRALRLRPPLTVAGALIYWERPAAALGSSPPAW
jgi:hypothetical protein